MNVRVIALSAPVIPEAKTAEELIVYVARVSNPANQTNMLTGPKLLRYCMRKGHWSVFETATMTVEVETSMAIGEQVLRHRSFCFQKFSGRYAVFELGFEDVKARRQDAKNRQNSIDDLPEGIQAWFENAVWWNNKDAQMRYQDALEHGIAKECARFLLPGNTRTRFYMTGNVRSWIHYLMTRDADGVQKEHRELSQAIRRVFNEHFPVVAEAMREHLAAMVEQEELAARMEALEATVDQLKALLKDAEQVIESARGEPGANYASWYDDAMTVLEAIDAHSI